MQVWPRKRAKRAYPRVRSVPEAKDAKPLTFAGYKAGMTHVMALDTHKTSMTKGEKIAIPVTVIECPPVKISSLRVYTPSGYGFAVTKELFFKADKSLLRKTPHSKKLSTEKDIESIDASAISDVTIQIYTQPKLVGFGKKTPEVFEIALGGSVEDKLAFVKEHIGKEIAVKDVLTEGATIDVHAITKGKGFQGPVKRFGVGLRSHKSEKTIRGPGSLGAWKAQGHFMYRIAFAGQMGYHQRFQHNSRILAILDDPAKVNPAGGFINYGEVKSTYILLKGSTPGPKKRLVLLTAPHRVVKQKALPSIEIINTDSKQGN
jgi:large subunit ribosomal protein L3